MLEKQFWNENHWTQKNKFTMPNILFFGKYIKSNNRNFLRFFNKENNREMFGGIKKGNFFV